MAWTTPTSATVQQILNAARWNSEVRDNLRYLRGLDGPISLLNLLGVYVPSTGDNATAALYLGDSGGTARAGIWGQRNGSNQGGRLIGLTLNDSGVLTEAYRIDQNQRMGVGTTDPLLRWQARDGSASGNIGFWSGGGINATPQTILPTSAGVTVAGVIGVCTPSAPTSSFSPEMRSAVLYAPTTESAIFATGSPFTNAVLVSLASGGVTIRRSAGSDIYRAALWVFWF